MFSDFTEESRRERQWCGQRRLPAGGTPEGVGLLNIELRQCFIAVQIPTDLVTENCCFNAQYKICAYMKGIGKRPPANTLLLHKRGAMASDSDSDSGKYRPVGSWQRCFHQVL